MIGSHNIYFSNKTVRLHVTPQSSYVHYIQQIKRAGANTQILIILLFMLSYQKWR